MAVIINASTSTGLVQSADTSGIIQFQSNGSTKATLNSSGFSYPGGALQSAFVYKQDTFVTTSTSYVDVTGLSVSITPKSASNYIVVLGAVIVSNVGDMGAVRLVRDSTPIQVCTAQSLRYSATHDMRVGYDSAVSESVTLAYRDSPGTTSPVTYKIQAGAFVSGTVRINASGGDEDQTNRGRFASTILLLEFAP